VPLSFIWWMLAAGDGSSSWVVGVPCVLAATTASVLLADPSRSRVNVLGLARFVPYFIWRSMLGSFDVAWRAVQPRLPISPSLHEYPLRLPSGGPARVFFADVVNLLPGTLSAELTDRWLTVHILNGESAGVLAELRQLENKVGDVFGVELKAAGDSTEGPDD
jgi:multicomponent Na+:H+ antiporter subunit E